MFLYIISCKELVSTHNLQRGTKFYLNKKSPTKIANSHLKWHYLSPTNDYSNFWKYDLLKKPYSLETLPYKKFNI